MGVIVSGWCVCGDDGDSTVSDNDRQRVSVCVCGHDGDSGCDRECVVHACVVMIAIVSDRDGQCMCVVVIVSDCKCVCGEVIIVMVIIVMVADGDGW